MPCDSGSADAYADLIPGTDAYDARVKREKEEQAKKDKLKQEATEERRHQETLEAIRQSHTPKVIPQGHYSVDTNINPMEAVIIADEYAKAFCALCHLMAKVNPAELKRLHQTNDQFARVFSKHQEVDRRAGRPTIDL